REIIQWNNEQKQYGQKHQFLDFKPSLMIPLLVSNNDFRYVETSGDDGLEETPVIEWNHEQPSRDVKYGSFENYLSTFAERLEFGEYITDANDQQNTCGLALRK
ncbi:unnamed protein product, partial [Rotaria socialis]